MEVPTFPVSSEAPIRREGPKAPGHHTIGRPCARCLVRFGAGDFTAFVPLEPWDDEERGKAEAGGHYIAAACEVHWRCVTAEELLAAGYRDFSP
jgi:hypothetical protein